MTEIRLFDNKLYQQKMSKFIQDLWIIGHMTTLHMFQHEINIVHLAAQIIPIHVTKEGSQTQTGIILLSDDFDRIIIHTRINKDQCYVAYCATFEKSFSKYQFIQEGHL